MSTNSAYLKMSDTQQISAAEKTVPITVSPFLSQGMLIIDAHYKVLEWNMVCKEMTGYDRCSIMNRSILDLLSLEDQQLFKTRISALCKQCDGMAAMTQLEIKLKKADAKNKKVILSVLRVQTADSVIFNIQISDVKKIADAQKFCPIRLKELRRKEKELQKMSQSNQQLESFAYVASHDLKEPLRSIGNFAQLLEKRIGDKLDDTEQEFFNFITNGVKNMNSLIEDLLTYSRINTEDHSIADIQPMDTLAIVMNSLHQRIVETDATIEIKALPPTIKANSTKIKQIFQNLIANALKFQRPGIPPTVVIKGEEKSDTWEFSVTDNGIGIKEEYYDKVFGIFTKLHHKSVYSGSGIGLSVCQRIAEQHGGEIWLKSQVDKGTTFWFSVEKK